MSTDTSETTNTSATTETSAKTETTNTTEPTVKPKPTGARDTVYIGKKPLMAYVTSTLIQLANTPSVSIKARGMSIGRAVDVAQILSRKTENAGYKIGKIQIGSESLESQDGRQRNVSTIDIEMKRGQ
jgi:archaea-specific DNA-binding protein